MAGGPGKHFAALDLSPQQKQQIDQSRNVAMKQAEPLRAQMDQKMNELRNLWRADRLDRGTIVHKQAELDAIRDKQRNIWTDFRLQVHAVLTPEQRIKWADHVSGRPGFGDRHGRGWMHDGHKGRGFGPGGFDGPECSMHAK